MLDRTIAPPFNRSTSFDLISPHKVLTRGGAEVYFVLGGTQDVCKVELIFPAGRWFEKNSGASYFCSQLLSKGTTKKNSYEIAQHFDRYGAHLEINPGMDVVSISLYMLNKNLEVSLELLLELLTDSVFPLKELDQLKSIYLQNMKVNREKTSYLASTLIRKNIFGETHSYGRELEDEAVEKIQQSQLVDHHKEYFGAATILVSGNVSQQHQKVIKDMLGVFLLNPLTSVEQETLLAEAETAREIVRKEGSVQSTIRIGKSFIGRSHPDYADVQFLNHILGGYFGSRLMKNIREEKGLSYGISSSLHTMKMGNYLVIGADVNRENLDVTFEEIHKELRRLREAKVGADELETARNHFIGSMQLEITTSFAHADKIKNILLFGLPQNFYQELIARVDKVTEDDLLRVAERYFHEDSFMEVAVG